MNIHSDENFLARPYEKVDYEYLGEPQSWEKEVWGFDSRGIGDLWYRLFRMIILTDDKSDWAFTAFMYALTEMVDGKRWPDEYNNEHISRNWLEFKWTYLLYKLGLRKTRKYRSQKSMTRDPWIMMYCCVIHFGDEIIDHKYFIKNYPPPWWLYRTKVWQWRKALIGKRNIYRFLDKISPKKRKDFVMILDQYMRDALNKINKV